MCRVPSASQDRLHADHVTSRMARGPAGDPRAFPRTPRLSAARSIVQSSSSSHRSTRSSFANGPERGARPGISDGSVPTGTRRTPAAAAVGHRRPGPAAPRPTPHPGMARDQTGMEEIDHRTSRLRITRAAALSLPKLYSHSGVGTSFLCSRRRC